MPIFLKLRDRQTKSISEVHFDDFIFVNKKEILNSVVERRKVFNNFIFIRYRISAENILCLCLEGVGPSNQIHFFRSYYYILYNFRISITNSLF